MKECDRISAPARTETVTFGPACANAGKIPGRSQIKETKTDITISPTAPSLIGISLPYFVFQVMTSSS